MKKGTLNFIVDFTMLVNLLGLMFTAVIFRYVLPPGTGGRGGGWRGEDFWSLSRHEWGDIHFYLAILFIVLMVCHIFLHWTWIKSYSQSLFARKSGK